MALSNTWTIANEVYVIQPKSREELTKMVYRDPSNGFEAFIVGETENAWLIDGNGCRCKIKKCTTKRKIHKVSESYQLKVFSYKGK